MFLNINKINVSLYFKIILSLTFLVNLKLFSDESDSVIQKRQALFFNQRSYPVDSIPYSVYYNSVQQKMSMQNQSYYLNPSSSWSSLGPRLVNGFYLRQIRIHKV